jgi:FKBP-type peptidyl-prolyl cis-trans isomerase
MASGLNPDGAQGFVMSVQEYRYADKKVSSGPVIEAGDTISLLYRVALSEDDLDARRLLESNDSPENPIDVIVSGDELLLGVYRALIGMRAGGSIRRVFIPPDFGYGSRGWKGVPPNAGLVIDLLTRIIVKKGER